MKKQQFIIYVTIAIGVLLASSVVLAHPAANTSGKPAYPPRSSERIVVTNTNDDGAGSLRQAILEANAAADETLIAFDISGNGVHTIEPLSPLPTITAPVVIDGLTQSGARCHTWPASLRIELNGSQAGADRAGLHISAGNSVVRGLVINRFDGHGIVLNTNPGNTLECNFIGTDVTGTVALGNQGSGVVIENIPNNLIGGTGPAARNLVSGNRTDGIAILGRLAQDNTVAGNFIGTDATGNVALGNSVLGVYISDAPRNMIGGLEAGARNIISGNGFQGIYLHSFNAQGNIVAGNYIGTNLTGTEPLGNGASGIVISQASDNTIGWVTPEGRNVISGNAGQGVYIFDSHHIVVTGNYIGIDALCISALGNAGSGVQLDMAPDNTIGGESLNLRNVISGNRQYGIHLYGERSIGNIYSGNVLGTDVTGKLALNNEIADIYEDRGGSHELGESL